MLKRARRALLVLALAALVLSTAASDYRPTALELAVAPYRYSLVQWELSNFMDKWLHLLRYHLPWHSKPTRAERLVMVQEFFALSRHAQALERQLLYPAASGGGTLSPLPEAELRAEVQSIQERRRSIRPEVEEAIEAEISAILAEEGFASRVGLIFPPVDAVLTSSPTVLVMSPRDRIERLETILLAPGLTNDQRHHIEELVLREQGLSALVESTGGLAAYPSVVSDAAGLRHVLEVVAHEWLHHWFFFRPLGRNFWSSPEMVTLNETAATLGGREIGERAYAAMLAMTAEDRPPEQPASAARPSPAVFDFAAAMRETRRQAEELLAQGFIDEAEAYMEERRQHKVVHGYLIRRINQAYFAFHGSYATSPASVSPIDRQLRELRARSESLGDFLRTVAQFGSYDEFLRYMEDTSKASAG